MEMMAQPGSRRRQACDQCGFSAMDGILMLASVSLAVAGDAFSAIRDYPDRIWPRSGGVEAATQILGWILYGIFFAGPFILGRQFVMAPVKSWDLAEHMWCWIPTAWLLLFVLSLVLPEHPVLILIAIPLMWVFPLMVVAGCISLWKSISMNTGQQWKWTSICGSTIAILIGLYAVVSILRNPPII
jgi:hypothetical protein